MRHPNSNTSGSVLIWTVLVITVLSLAAAELLHVVSSKYTNALHTAQWQESLLAAESGVDLGIRELRKSLFPPPHAAWDGWTSADTTSSTLERHGITVIPNAGLAGTEMKIDVTVDAPLQLRDPGNSWQYYRIRAIGTMPITGPARANDNKQDTRLRKLSLRNDRFTGGVLQPSEARVARRVETIVRPVSAFDQAIISDGVIDLTDQNIIIDSYDSRDSTKSTGGLYDVNKRQTNGNIATNGTLINAGNARVYGDVATNSGTVTGAGNVTGTQRTDFYKELIPVGAPNWPSINPTPMIINTTTTLATSATEGSAASRYVLSSLTLAGSQKLTFAGAADGSTRYIEIYVTGAIDATGTSEIIVDPGVKAVIFFGNTVRIAGNGIINRNNQPGNLLIYGVTPADNTTRTVEIGGTSLLSAGVYAPAYNVQINNGGTRGSVFGSYVGKTVKMNGVTDLHYDEALGSGGRISDYKIVSWFEDTR